MSETCSLTNFPFFFLHGKPTDQCFPFGSIPPGALQRKIWGLFSWNQPLYLYYYILNDFSVQNTVLWKTKYKETFKLVILLAIVKKCGHCVPDKLLFRGHW